MNTLVRIALIALILAAVPLSGAGAVLLEIDLEFPGDAAVTRDTETGLDWLDLDQTIGRSVDDIERNVGGWAGEGWRHATASEVCGLMETLSFAPILCPGPFTGQDEPEALEEGLFAFLGPTSVLLFPSGQAIALYDDDGNNPALFGELNAWLITDSSSHLRILEDVTRKGVREPRTGHLLVRTVVPEPSTGLLVLSGLVALRATRARKGPRA